MTSYEEDLAEDARIDHIWNIASAHLVPAVQAMVKKFIADRELQEYDEVVWDCLIDEI